MKIEFNLTQKTRKELAKTIADITGAECRYMGMPSAAYAIDYFTVNADGTLEFDDRADSEEIENLLEKLTEQGFEVMSKEYEPSADEAIFTIEMPADKVNLDNLNALLKSKGSLIKKALDIKELPVETVDNRVAFNWFKTLDSSSAKAYAHFISALCKMSVEQSRISSKEKEVANKKYTFRCFLLRLGFIGKEYKDERKILLKNLSGSSAFKNGGKNDAVSEQTND